MKRILIVKDDTLLNKTLPYNLTAAGYDITLTLNARTATYDLMLLDINLPDGNGYDLCKIIKPTHPIIHVLPLSYTASR